MARQCERVDEDTTVGPRFGQDPPPSFSAPTLAYTYRQWERDLRLWQATSSLQKHEQGGWLLSQLKGESGTAAEVVMDDALVQDDGIDLIVEELDRCWQVTQDQDKASVYETQRDVKMETTFMYFVARRKLNFQQLENALGTPLPAVNKGYTTPRDAKLAESSYDKVVMWTGGSYDYDDVVRALVRLDRPEMRPGTSGQSGKTVPTYSTDPEVDAPTIVPGSELWTHSSMDRPQWNEILDGLQEDADFCEDGTTTIARDGAIAIQGFSTSPTMDRRQLKKTRYRRYYYRLDQLSDTVPGHQRGSQCCAEVKGFLRSQTKCQWQRSGTAHEALEHSTAETAHEMCKMSQTWMYWSQSTTSLEHTHRRTGCNSSGYASL